MAHKLGLRVVAEGVETPAQRALLREVGCDYAQGFLFDQAQPLEVFEYRLQLQLAEGVASAWAGLAG
jgi:EAL domain-containing protein (putative c-di-GMP-specific phosphodiesterase class I)